MTYFKINKGFQCLRYTIIDIKKRDGFYILNDVVENITLVKLMGNLENVVHTLTTSDVSIFEFN